MNHNQNKSTKGKKLSLSFHCSQSPLANLPTWSKFPIVESSSRLASSAVVLINHHLITIIHNGNEPTTLLAVDLYDNSVQQAEAPESMFSDQEKFTLTSYKDNQIIKYGGLKDHNPIGDIVRITIESFQRIILWN